MKSTLFTILILTIISCSKQSELREAFNCNVDPAENTVAVYDFNKNFKLNIPNNWKTELYYDKYQSEIFTADTTKQLTSTFILDASFNLGALNFDEDFQKKTDSILTAKNLQKLKFGNVSFQSKPAFWYLAKGEKNNFNYHQLNLTVQLSENTYFNAYSEIYGEDHIEIRICEAIAILETIEFLQ